MLKSIDEDGNKLGKEIVKSMVINKAKEMVIKMIKNMVTKIEIKMMRKLSRKW